MDAAKMEASNNLNFYVMSDDQNVDENESLFVDDGNVDDETARLLERSQNELTSSSGVTYPAGNQDDEDSVPLKSVNLSTNLPYQRRIIRDLLDEDGLLVLGRGLGMSLITANLLYAMDVAGTQRHPLTGVRLGKENLVLLINARENQIQHITENMWEIAEFDNPNNRRRGITVVNTDRLTGKKRVQMYSEGGVFCITSRILIVDLLAHGIDCSKVTGIVVLNAHRVTQNSTEAFILNYFRKHNKKGFIKALSDEPEGFLSGFAPLSTKIKSLCVKKVMLWPRFQIDVIESLVFSSNKTSRKKDDSGISNNQLIEIQIEMSPHMVQIQTAIMECIQACISQLKRTNTGLDTENWNLDNALTKKSFVQMIRLQLDPVWHRISWRARQVVSDIKSLVDLAHELPSQDCISFFFRVENLWVSNSFEYRPAWMTSNAGDDLFRLARERVYPYGRGKKARTNAPAGYEIEEPPKWHHLSHILDEVVADRATSQFAQGCILILCERQSTARQLTRYLKYLQRSSSGAFSGQRYLHVHLHECELMSQGLTDVQEEFAQKTEEKKKPERANKRRRVRGGGAVGTGRIAAGDSAGSVGGDGNDDELENVEEGDVETIQESDSDEDIAVVDATPDRSFKMISQSDVVVVQTYDSCTLEELRPSYVVMYEPYPEFFRRLEVLRAHEPDRPIKPYLLFYGSSVEEQRFLAQVAQEKDAFTKLIRERANMPVVLDTEEDQERQSLLKAVSSRIAGGGLTRAPGDPNPRVVIDMREFRSSLPYLLYQQGLDVVPVQLTVGDYIISPRICVERKSISDLVSSFRDGRLYTQCEVMFRYYEQPTLLIEFDENQSFSLVPFSDTPGGAASAETAQFIQENIQQKLAILLITYPQLKIIWSSSPAQSAEIFVDLKRNNAEPDPQTCGQMGLGQNEQPSLYNHAAVDMLRAIPGVTAKNSYLIMSKVKNIKQLCTMSLQDLADIVGMEPANKIHGFIHRRAKPRNNYRKK